MPFTVTDALIRCIEHREIFPDEMSSLMHSMMNGELSSAQISALLMGLRVKKETIGEITAAAQVLRKLATTVQVIDKTHLVDIVGTGGDNSHTFNISTAAMFVSAAAGAKVAKHGNRGVSSCSGSADVLEALGANIMLNVQQIAKGIETINIGFMFAPNHHKAMHHVAQVRKELKVRTLFNILGPLVNPASAPNILMGVFHPDLTGIQVRVLQRLGVQRALVIYGQDGIDEISLGAPTLVSELSHGEIREYTISPEDFGFERVALEKFKVESIEQSREILIEALTPGQHHARHAYDIICLNSGAALYAAGVVHNIQEGIVRARATIASGAARAQLDQFIHFTQTC